MPGEFYIEGKKQQETLEQLRGEEPVTGATVANWQLAESEIVLIGETGKRFKIHDMTLSIHNLVGNQITVRLYKPVYGIERCCYEQVFDAGSDPPGPAVREECDAAALPAAGRPSPGLGGPWPGRSLS